MSKPESIEFELHSWSIEYESEYFDYESEYFDSDRRDKLHYMAHVRWSAITSNKDKPVIRAFQNLFTTFEAAKKWIDEEIKS